MRRSYQEPDLRIGRSRCRRRGGRSSGVAKTPTPRNIGANLRRIRTAAGLTQGQLGERADVADATISRIERGRLDPSSDLLGKLAGALRVKADDLLGPIKQTAKPSFRPSIARLVAVVDALDDAQVDDVTKGIKLLLAVARRSLRR